MYFFRHLRPGSPVGLKKRPDMHALTHTSITRSHPSSCSLSHGLLTTLSPMLCCLPPPHLFSPGQSLCDRVFNLFFFPLLFILCGTPRQMVCASLFFLCSADWKKMSVHTSRSTLSFIGTDRKSNTSQIKKF